ncbi:MAG: competence protein ComEA [Burkholderiaceae bacterium]|jgi:competence protein ComEA
MFKKKCFLVICSMLVFTRVCFAAATVDVNQADQAALDGIRGVGPRLSQTILDERKKGGNFKDWLDLEQRVKGIKKKSAVRLSNAGLTVDGHSHKAVGQPK